ncbi:MAG TPA: HAD family hydrolase [Terriglobales bacterium]|nr:HAD family hydrolase [Terriglobales bacterium]
MAGANRIAVIFDFDDTLAEDSTAALISYYSDPERKDPTNKAAQVFYDEAADLVSHGWDPPLAYLTLLVDKVKSGALPQIRKEDLNKIGREFVIIHKGVDQFLTELRQTFETDPLIIEEKLTLEYYIVSGGIGDVVRSAPIAHHFKEIWACEYDFDDGGVIARPKAVISFTEKTRYLFLINKGISREQSYITPYAVNVDMPLEDRPVPLSHMIYVGDGPSDIPCMSVLEKAKPKGNSILVWGEKTVNKAWEIGERGKKCPRDYEKWGKQFIIGGVMTVARNIASERSEARRKRFGKNVGYSQSGKPSQN